MLILCQSLYLQRKSLETSFGKTQNTKEIAIGLLNSRQGTGTSCQPKLKITEQKDMYVKKAEKLVKDECYNNLKALKLWRKILFRITRFFSQLWIIQYCQWHWKILLKMLQSLPWSQRPQKPWSQLTYDFTFWRCTFAHLTGVTIRDGVWFFNDVSWNFLSKFLSEKEISLIACLWGYVFGIFESAFQNLVILAWCIIRNA